MTIQRRVYAITIVCLLSLPAALLSGATKADENPSILPVERYALYVAANDGGSGREILRYAVMDAKRLAMTMSEIGGVKAENSLILTDPGRGRINEAFSDFARQIRANKGRSKRTEFIFYYSGHSNEKELLLGKDSYTYADLKESLSKVPSDVHVVMLDSCFSGSFIRTKGGSRQKPFLMDDASTVQGHAYLSSSSAHESSQESDAIQASYFTHSIVTGLRGAADTSGDRKVSLNELYYYAFNDTLLKTEKSNYGPQHPSFNITLVGSGDLVLTDISEADSVIIFPLEASGQYFIRTPEGQLVSEINKVEGTELALALEDGTYVISLITPTTTTQSTILLAKGQRLILSGTEFSVVTRSEGRSRGDETVTEEQPIEWTPFVVSIVPGLTIPSDATSNAKISLGAIMAQNTNIHVLQASTFLGSINGHLDGVQASFVVNTLTGDFNGLQVSGILNTAGGPSKGWQGSAFTNIMTGDLHGGQAAGFLNISRGTLAGVQASGFLNVATDIDGVQVGLVNVAKRNSGMSIGLLNFIGNGVMDVGVYMDSDSNLWLQYQGGTRYFFTTVLAGYETRWNVNGNGETAQVGLGIGTRLPLASRLSLDIEAIGRAVIDLTDGNPYMDTLRDGGEIRADSDSEKQKVFDEFYAGFIPSLRLTLNVSFFRNLAAFVALNADVRIEDFNDGAFAIGTHNFSTEIGKDTVTLYPSISVGLKF